MIDATDWLRGVNVLEKLKRDEAAAAGAAAWRPNDADADADASALPLPQTPLLLSPLLARGARALPAPRRVDDAARGTGSADVRVGGEHATMDGVIMCYVLCQRAGVAAGSLAGG